MDSIYINFFSVRLGNVKVKFRWNDVAIWRNYLDVKNPRNDDPYWNIAGSSKIQNKIHAL